MYMFFRMYDPKNFGGNLTKRDLANNNVEYMEEDLKLLKKF